MQVQGAKGATQFFPYWNNKRIVRVYHCQNWNQLFSIISYKIYQLIKSKKYDLPSTCFITTFSKIIEDFCDY